jgi:beta-glucosidase
MSEDLSRAPYRDPKLSAEERVADLLGRMTLEEKIAQLFAVWLGPPKEGGEGGPFGGWTAGGLDVAELLRHGVGQITRPFGTRPVEPERGARALNRLQRHLLEDTRLGIPAIAHEESLTGVMAQGATQFPAPLNYGSTWDPELVERVGGVIRRQMRALGVHQALAPVADVIRDARWGRVEECVSEDPYLTGLVVSAYVRGLQGDDLAHGVVATLKHFCAYSGSEGGRNFGPAHVGPRELADVFLIPFEMAVKLAGAKSVMNSYQEIDGEPPAASRRLLSEILRERWGFDGIVVADYFAVNMLHQLHRVAEGPVEAAAAALSAGLDVELPVPQCFREGLPEALARGLVDEPTIDRAVQRVLRLKFALGLFESPYVDAGAVALDLPEERELARRVAEKSITLLANHGVLPLDPRAGRLALIGPNADDPMALFGNYSFHNHVASFVDGASPPRVETLLDAIRARAGAERVSYAQGCAILRPRSKLEAKTARPGGLPDLGGGEERLCWDESGFPAAVAAAREADVAIAVVGDRAGNMRRGTVGEGTDTADLSLPGLQEGLVEAVLDTGTPTVVVLLNGRPPAIPRIAERAAAIVEAWFPGQEGAGAIADLIFGDLNPGGKTTVTFSRGAGVQPCFYDHRALAPGMPPLPDYEPVFAFGHGLSYTRFEYSQLEIEPSEVPVDGALRIACTVRNTGDRAGDEVVQLYLRDVVASLVRPVRELKGFRRISLEPGEACRVLFTLHADLLAFTGREGRRIVEPGRVEVMIGASSADIRLEGGFDLVGATRKVGEDRVLATAVEVERLPSGG